MWTGEGSRPMWTSTQKIKIRVHGCHTVFFSCKEVGIFFTRISSLDRKKVKICLRYKLVISITKSLNKLESYSRISALGPVGHCTSHFKRAVCISCRPCVDVHKGGEGSGPCGQGGHVDRRGQKRDF